jgi:hypothetical protein
MKLSSVAQNEQLFCFVAHTAYRSKNSKEVFQLDVLGALRAAASGPEMRRIRHRAS